MDRKLILISNDDGVEAEGIRQLTSMVRDLGDVVVCAPDSARSGSGMAFSCHTPLRLRRVREEVGLHVYSCNGTPCDCVKLACEMLVDRRPSIVLSGINHGDNAGVNALYSGTIAVCFEAALKHLPAVGFSSCKLPREVDFSALRPYVRSLTQAVLNHGLPDGLCLNVNAPDAETFAGVRLCRMGRGNWVNELEERTDPRQHKYWWVAGRFVSEETDSSVSPHEGSPHEGKALPSDLSMLSQGFITVTPLQTDLTAYSALDSLRQMLPGG